MKKILLLIIVCFFGIIVNAQEPKQAVIAFYNLENLFDTINDPNKNDEEFLPEGANQWTGERYISKQRNLAQVISLIGKEYGCPVVLGVSEIENEKVLLDLVAQESLKPYKYKVAHHDSPDLRGVDVSFIYQQDRFHFISLQGVPLIIPEKPYFITRDQVVLTGVIDNTDTLHIIINHWPSKRGGESRSLPLRLAAARLTRHITDSLLNANSQANILVMGDFNDNPNAKSFTQVLKPKGKIEEMTSSDLFNPMWKMYHDGIGSYIYQDNWEMLDQIMLSYNLLQKKENHYYYNKATIFYKNFMITKTGSYTGYPYRTYAGGTYNGGYSDHFPVYILLTK